MYYGIVYYCKYFGYLVSLVVLFYFWFFIFKIYNKIVGFLVFNLVGNMFIKGSGMLFDGVSVFVEIFFLLSDCLQDLDQCVGGFFMGIKVKFDEVGMLYKEFKYIVDSGVCSLIMCGVFMYIVNGNLFFELVIVKKVWKVCI